MRNFYLAAAPLLAALVIGAISYKIYSDDRHWLDNAVTSSATVEHSPGNKNYFEFQRAPYVAITRPDGTVYHGRAFPKNRRRAHSYSPPDQVEVVYHPDDLAVIYIRSSYFENSEKGALASIILLLIGLWKLRPMRETPVKDWRSEI